MNTFSTWGEALRASLVNLWVQFTNVIPNIIGAILILIVGFVLANLIGRLVKRLLEASRVDQAFERTGLTQRLSAGGMHFTLSGLVGWLAKWFLIVVVLTAVAEILNWDQLTWFMASVAGYIPRVLVAMAILLVGFIAGRFIGQVVRQAVTASRLPTSSANMLGVVAEWAIVIFAFMASFVQLGIAANLIQILFTGLVAALALSFGLAFGLGGRDQARAWLERLEREMRDQK